MTPSIQNILSMIVQLSLDRHTGDAVRDIYDVLMELMLETTKLFQTIRKQENA